MNVNKTLFTIIIVSAIILAGCGSPATLDPTAQPAMPTPTFHALFSGSETRGAATTEGDSEPLAIPTVADYFSPGATWAPPPPPTPDTSNVEVSLTNSASEMVTRTVVIYDDTVSQGWASIASPDMEVDLEVTEPVHTGERAIAIKPNQDFSTLSLVISSDNHNDFPRDQVLGVSFWLNSGDNYLDLEDLAITVMGSNDYSFFVSNDRSVTNVYEPVFSETRLYFLGLNQAIPPNTWIQVDLWLADRVYDPIYAYVTGIYFKTGEGFRDTIYIDDVSLILLDESAQTAGETEDPGTIIVGIDLSREVHVISPLIYGISGLGADEQYLESLHPTLNSWGGNPNTRYNWELGNAWNAGRDWEYRNGNYGVESGSASDLFIADTKAISAEVRLAVPTLGWVAKDTNNDTCSFPLPDGTCGDAGGATCENPGLIADPKLANVESDVDSIVAWMEHLFAKDEQAVRFVAMDNEPELWGVTHYDVHPECTTYQEILDKYLDYATAIREAVPQVELVGPVTCCWNYYWNSAAGYLDKINHGNEDFLPWFLSNVRAYDQLNGIRTLDVLDIHYYPEGLYNDNVDDNTAAWRLRSTRSLWDADYIDESWINEAVNLIPRMKALIDRNYPGTKFGISEWNWGAEKTVNGALAIADVLGIFGRENLYYANYWTFPPLNSPGFFAFKLYTNYNGRGDRFGDTSIWTTANHIDKISNYAAVDSTTGDLHLMLINKLPSRELTVQIDLDEFKAAPRATYYRYGQSAPNRIVNETIPIPANIFDLELPPYSITHLVIPPLK